MTTSEAWRSGPFAILAALVIVLAGHLIGAILVLIWMQASQTAPERLGLRRPASWPRTMMLGVIAGIGLKLASKTLLMPSLGFTANNTAYQYLVGNRFALPGVLFSAVAGGGIGEELIWRGFLFERLGTWFRTGSSGRHATIIVLTSILFAAAHYLDQGVPGVVQALMTGLVFAIVYAWTRSLVLPMVLHGSFDVAAVLIIYLNLESRLAHLFLR